MDYGKKGLQDTLQACADNNLPTVGAGLNIELARQAFIKNVNGVNVAIIAIAEHEFNQSENGGSGSAPIDAIDNYQQIKKAQSEADIVIVTLHAGNEYFPYPRPGLRKLCHHFVDLGVDAVICHHPHVPGAYEYYQGKPIIYSLGNFIFDVINPPKDWELGYMAQLEFDLERKGFMSLELIPYKQSVQLGGVQLLQGEEKNTFLHRIESYRQVLDNNEGWLKEWKGFVQKQAGSYILRQYMPLISRGKGFIANKLPIVSSFFFSKRTRDLDKLNILRCQSHRELLMAALKEKSKPRNE